MRNLSFRLSEKIVLLFLALVVLALPTYAAYPTTSASAISNDTSYSFGTWTLLPVTVSLTCNAGTSNCANISYCIDTTNTCDPTSGGTLYSAPFDVSEEGISYMRYASDNNSGSWGTVSNNAIEIDTTPPILTIVDDASTSWTNDDQIEVGVDDGNGSGIEQTMWIAQTDSECDSTKDSDLDSGTSGTIVQADNDTLYQGQYICFRSTDRAGNTGYASSSRISYLDTTPPIVDVGPDVTENTQFSPNTEITDTGSGVVSVAWTEDSGPGTVTFGTPYSQQTTLRASADGTYVISLQATDAAGNSGSGSFNLNWETTPPGITISNPSSSPARSKTVSATTSKGTLSMSITTGTVCDATLAFQAYQPETFSSESDNGKSVCYKAADEAGNAAYLLSTKISSIDTTKPVITLEGNPSVTVEVGSAYSDAGAKASDNLDGDITTRMVINNSVNSSRIGAYTVTYDASDAAGNAADRVSRSVIIADTTKPVISLNGNSSVTLEQGKDYTDSGATAYDNYDGNITSQIVTVNPVNTNATGTYTITYDVSDSSGNKAAEVSRTVKVENNLLPLLIIGAIAAIVIFVLVVSVVVYLLFIRKK